MITKLILENFMAHERTELSLGPGVTALTGPNNTGKSAVVEALRCVATNPAPRNYIRHGAKEARVTVELADGTRVVWVRRKASAGYELWAPGAEEPEEYWKFGRTPPDDVLNALRLDVVGLEGGKEIDVHIGNQREPIFLLNRPDSDAAAFFAASTESAHLLAMQNLLKRRTQDAARRERDLEERRDMLAPLPDIGLALETARDLERTAARLQVEIPAIEAHRERMERTGRERDRRSAAAEACRALADPPKIIDVKGLDGLTRQIGRVGEDLARRTGLHDALAPVQAPPAPFDTLRLAILCERQRFLDRALQSGADRTDRLAGLAEPPVLQDVARLAASIADLRRLQKARAGAENICARLRSVAEPPEVRADARLAGLVDDIRAMARRSADAQAAADGLRAELRTVEESIRRVADALGHCPTCGANISGANFLDHGGDHDA